MIIEPDLVTDFGAKRLAAFRGDARGHGAGGDTTRLEDDDLLFPRQPGVEDHLRHLGGFAGAGGRDEHEAVAVVQLPDEVGVDLPDRKRIGGHGGSIPYFNQTTAMIVTKVSKVIMPPGMNLRVLRKRIRKKSARKLRMPQAT